MIKKTYVLSSLIIFSSLFLQAHDQNGSTAFVAFNFEEKQSYSYGDQF